MKTPKDHKLGPQSLLDLNKWSHIKQFMMNVAIPKQLAHDIRTDTRSCRLCKTFMHTKTMVNRRYVAIWRQPETYMNTGYSFVQ